MTSGLQRPSQQLVDDLVVANHILFHQGVVDAFGHVSVRHDKNPEHFLLARNMAPGTVGAEDIVTYTHDGTPLDADGRRVYLERFIHGSIYRARPDVMAVVHSHSPSVVPFTVSRQARLRPVCHMSGFLGAGAPLFEIREAAGDASDLLITSDGLGRALADSLASANCVLMRGHGSTVVAPTLKLAVYRAVYAEVNARLQAQALQLGDPEYLTEGEARAAMASTEGQVERPWALWKADAERALADRA
ncbi:class II aldolase/adducin family protein [Ramlibacter sp. G-1-2-2]|uniref:Class II aldolase/adducin family protein n=1 Tax=Ramlibacter agri TaxID=2728837 RepID=A0A848H809_9BURK|nr:class II aldolase/adducin family protein [Ramlibacter agri]NML44673.1 class II aldolase/adducin family protein [Ramlibacter agri]